ncbi:MAG TPA: prenyltransferase/squalene oxidase repeat-containing protein [Planctomycetota bacterium]|nr:prenyltransferase/squalene oxidase repeat-containing protein [Planctomycetota bacterium]
MRRALFLLLGLPPLAPGCGDDAAAPASPPRTAVPAPDLVRVGTIGDAPPDALEIALAAGGEIVTAAGPVDLDGLGAYLETECGATPWLEADGHSRRHVVFRVHPSLPFEVVAWALWKCYGAYAYRVHFAVRPEEGDDEGTMAVYFPNRHGADGYEWPPSRRVSLRADDARVDDGVAFALYRETFAADPDAGASVIVGPGIAAGQAIRTVDLLLRAGAKHVVLDGSLPDVPYPGGRAASGRTEIEEYVASHPVKAGGFRIRVGDRALVGDGSRAAPPPPVARVRGGIAGSTRELFSLQGSAIGIGGRRRDGRWQGGEDALVANGGSELTENAVEQGLRWLAAHQDVDADGRWDCDRFMKHDPPGQRCDGAGEAFHDVGVTGLAVLAFLRAGYLDREDRKGSKYWEHVRAGLNYLLRCQTEDGLFGTRVEKSFLYGHAIATLAVSEAFWRTRSPRYKVPAQRGLDYIARARNPYFAWRYEPRSGENDTSVTSWCVLALKEGKYAGLDIDPDAFEGARMWVDKMTDPRSGRVGYNVAGGLPARPLEKESRFPAEKSQSMTAAGILTRIEVGEDPRTSDPVRKGVELCLKCPPAWETDGSIDMYYWFFGTMALREAGGASWAAWNEALKAAVLPHQRADENCAGSWDPAGVWGEEGGRVYATALMVLVLDQYWD